MDRDLGRRSVKEVKLRHMVKALTPQASNVTGGEQSFRARTCEATVGRIISKYSRVRVSTGDICNTDSVSFKLVVATQRYYRMLNVVAEVNIGVNPQKISLSAFASSASQPSRLLLRSSGCEPHSILTL